MTYNTLHVSYPSRYLSTMKDYDMKNCLECSKSFKPVGPESTCSIRCKLINKSEKSTGCWFFNKSTSGVYSKVRWQKKWYLAHRMSYMEFVGDIPVGKWICHKCDQPKCINPVHLFAGSASENMKDAASKKRLPIGENNHFSKYTDIQVEEMRILRKDGLTYERLCRIFNCSMAYLNLLFNKKLRRE